MVGVKQAKLRGIRVNKETSAIVSLSNIKCHDNQLVMCTSLVYKIDLQTHDKQLSKKGYEICTQHKSQLY